jgi:hypothetical protein
MEGLVVAVVIIIGLFIVGLLWQLARSIYYWTAAKIYGWSEEEKIPAGNRMVGSRDCEGGTPSKEERSART